MAKKQPEPGPWETFADAVAEAFRLARGEHSARMRGRRVRRFDSRGIHPFSEAMGRVGFLSAHPAVAERLRRKPTLEVEGIQVEPDPIGIQQGAEKVALRQFVDDAKRGAFDEDHDETTT